ncbi:MAG: aspartate/glutamate racemase family protein [Acidobacteria bacterium]|nr:aspartate/glutamate racemase family protein [Acidobacteriota bacterium]
MHLVITDSGLGGLGICAAIESALRLSGNAAGVRLTYFNAWPEQGRGYNSLPDQVSRLAYFDSALAQMNQLRPDRIVIACNTLSVLFDRTMFARTSATPVVGIIDCGVALFHDALSAEPGSSIALFGTRITIESGVHRDRLVQLGTAPERIVPVPCHGLAVAIEQDAGGAEVERLIDQSASLAAASLPQSGALFAGLCCTHYGYVADRFRTSLERACGRAVRTLDPNIALVRLVVPASVAASPGASSGAIRVDVISKVALDERTQDGIGRLVAPVSPATARALQSYAHVPGLF